MALNAETLVSRPAAKPKDAPDKDLRILPELDVITDGKRTTAALRRRKQPS